MSDPGSTALYTELYLVSLQMEDIVLMGIYQVA